MNPQRFFINSMAFLVGVILSGLMIIGSARAETYPALIGWHAASIAQCGSTMFPSFAAAKSCWISGIEASGTYGFCTTATATCTDNGATSDNAIAATCARQLLPSGTCSAHSSITVDRYCPAGQTYNSSQVTCTATDCAAGEWRSPTTGQCLPACPAGSTRLPDETCSAVCTPPQVPNAGNNGCENCALGTAYSSVLNQCVACSALGAPSANMSYTPNAQGNACLGSPGANGCQFPSTGTTVCISGKCYGNLGAPTGQGCVVGATTTNAENQTPTNEPPPSDPVADCLKSGGIAGTVNGTQVCRKPTSTEPVTTTKTETKTVVNPDQSTSTETKKTTTTTVDGKTTTTIETTAADGTKTTEVKQGSTIPGTAGAGEWEDKNDVLNACTEQPNLPICRDYCESHPDSNRAYCKDLGEITESQELDTKDYGTNNITEQSFASSGGCPSSIALPKGATLSFSWICDMLDAVRPMLLALAWLSAGLITVGAFKE